MEGTGRRGIEALLLREGWGVNHKRLERIWQREGLKVPRKQSKYGRLWLNDGSCVRLRPERRDHVWAYDFVKDRTTDGKPLRMLVVVDEFTRECLAINVARTLKIRVQPKRRSAARRMLPSMPQQTAVPSLRSEVTPEIHNKLLAATVAPRKRRFGRISTQFHSES